MAKFDKEEKDILSSYNKGEWRSVKKVKSEKSRYSQYARNTFQKDRRINIRISTKDLEGFQKRAREEGLPYQTFIASILHKYLSGKFVERR